MRSILVFLLIAACSNESKPGVQPAAGSQARASSQLALGEATIIELLDKRFTPVSRPAWKLHADGTTEAANDKTGEWREEVTVAADGTLTYEGQAVGKISEREISFAALGEGAPKPIAIAGNAISVQVWERERDGEDLVAKIELGNDGSVTVHHRNGPRVQWRVEAKDPAVMRTAFLVFGASIKTRID